MGPRIDRFSHVLAVTILVVAVYVAIMFMQANVP